MNTIALTLTLIAGLSSLVGYFIIYLKKDSDKIISSSLGLAAGVMLFVSIFDLLPNSLEYFKLSFYSVFSYIFWFLFFIIGVLLSLSLSDKISHKNDNLYRVGIVSLITLIIHNIPEGIITYLTTSLDYKTGVLLTISITLHNIPEGITIAIPIYYATKSKIKTFIYVFIAALAEPFGAILAHIFFENHLSNMLVALLYSIVAGIMAAISITELIPEAKLYSKKYTYIFMAVGIIVIVISHLLI